MQNTSLIHFITFKVISLPSSQSNTIASFLLFIRQCFIMTISVFQQYHRKFRMQKYLCFKLLTSIFNVKYFVFHHHNYGPTKICSSLGKAFRTSSALNFHPISSTKLWPEMSKSERFSGGKEFIVFELE